MAQSLKTQWSTNATNGKNNANTVLKLIGMSLDKYRSDSDWTDIAHGIAAHKAVSTRDGARIAAIVQAVSGLRFKDDAKQPSGLRAIKPKGAEASTNKLELLAQYYASGVSFRSGALENDDDLPALLEGKDPKVRTVEEIILAAVRKARKDQPDAATDARIVQALNTALAAD